MNELACLIIGYGRMGKLYHRILKKLGFKKIYVITKPLKNKNKKNFFTNINQFKKLKIQIYFAIISTTTNLRKFYIDSLLDLKPEFIMAEKPLSNSINNILEIIKKCKNNKIKLSVNHSYRFSKPIKLVKSIIQKKKLGKIIGINIVGGNMGIAMNAIHFFELFNFLTKNNIHTVSAKIDRIKLINPRGKKFKDNSGIIFAENKKNQYLYVNILNSQGHGKSISIIFKNGIIYIDELNKKIILNIRKEKNYILKTKYYNSKSFFKIINYRDSLFISTKFSILNFLRNGKEYVTGKDTLEATRSVVASIISGNQKGKKIRISSINSSKSFLWA